METLKLKRSCNGWSRPLGVGSLNISLPPRQKSFPAWLQEIQPLY